MVKRIIIIVIFSLFAQRSSSSLTLGTCNLQCNGKDGQQEMGLPSSSIREHLRGYPGKMGSIGLPGPIGPKGEPGASCDSLNEDFDVGMFSNYFPRTCTDLIPNHGVDASGVYKIYPFGNSTALLAYCDLTTAGGGWMLIQRRMDGSEDFFRNFSDYVRGFGKLKGEFWLGLTMIHELTNTGDYEVRFDMEDFENATRYAQYRTFRVGTGTTYTLSIGNYEGDAGDSMSFHNLRHFSTKDRDQDIDSSRNCAERFQGGWWHATCHKANPNGLYLGGATDQFATGVVWHTWRGYRYSLKKMEIKIRKKNQ